MRGGVSCYQQQQLRDGLDQMQYIISTSSSGGGSTSSFASSIIRGIAPDCSTFGTQRTEAGRTWLIIESLPWHVSHHNVVVIRLLPGVYAILRNRVFPTMVGCHSLRASSFTNIYAAAEVVKLYGWWQHLSGFLNTTINANPNVYAFRQMETPISRVVRPLWLS